MIVHNYRTFLALEDTGVIDESAQKHGNILQLLSKDRKPGDKLTFEDWRSIPETIRSKIADEINENIPLMKRKYWTLSSYISLVSPEMVLKKAVNPRNALKAKPYCSMTIPTCSKGFELKNSLYKEDFWNNSYGWHCAKCPPMTYKDVDINSKCKPCIYPYKTNEARTICFAPYRVDYLQMYSSTLISLSLLSTINGIATLFTMIWFWRLRETPIVKKSSLKVTMLHPSSNLILSIIPQFLFLSEPNRFICLLKTFNHWHICFTTNISVSLGKTQKLNLIFKSITIPLDNEKRFIDTIEFLVISILVILDVFILITTYVNQTIEVIFTIDETSVTKEMTCKQWRHYCSLFFVLIVVLANCIEAVRSQKLPSHFKETTHIIYSSFISVIVLAAQVVIYFI